MDGLTNNQGIINSLLINTGIAIEPINILYTQYAVVIGLVYNYLPFVVLTIFSSVSKLDKNLIEASEDLGARSFSTFLKLYYR